ncbi:hypothetical protein QF035_010184 [Streptomyces umbrinus]|uniref:Secreted protein n=1 Tax=Streptomyces umbrinus TaxID=67370 RepID=A0ABU0TAJ3_9ACTN|nr:hypothetical protein [Streptomyces umbrinus]MDQ1032602.1 hypothetical protein [Streptomyces umbrinus]
MRTRHKSRVFTLLAASAVLVGSSLTLGAGNAAAATWTFEKGPSYSDGTFSIIAYNNGRYAGLMEWRGDPLSGYPGDAFRVFDKLSDGRGMEAKMILPVTGRKATTRGHSAEYFSPWSTGDLTEGTKVTIQLCSVAGDYADCSFAYSGHA